MGQPQLCEALTALPELPPRLVALLAPGSPLMAMEAARLCGALSFRSGGEAAPLRLGEAGAIEALVALLRVNHAPAVCQALMAAANLMGSCPANRERFLAAGAAAELQRLLRVRGEDVVARAAYCACVTAEGSPEGQQALAAAGCLPPLVRCLRNTNPDVAARAVVALEALVRDCRPNALAVAAAGGIAPLAALLEAAAEPQPGLWRRCVDLWLGLGGLPALGKLLGHKSPAVVERAASLVREIAEGNDAAAKDRLRRCGVAAAVLRAARHRHMRVCESALRAVVALARLDQEPEQGRPTSATAAGAAAGAAPSSSSGGGGGGGGKGGASPRGPPPGFGGGKPQGAAANGGGGTAAAAAAAPSLRAQLVDAGALGVLQSLQGHKRVAIARLAAQASQELFIKPGQGR